ncbi:MAG TPA: WXG100 family type VII secretion target [Anaerolineae bacterium]|nr:WXG100 family type VII secretion target [Anaerolineae bacterium]
MGNDIIQAQYDQLEQIAVRFGQQAEAAAQTTQRVQQSMRALQAGGWEGRGAAAFFGEMERSVLPSMQRLSGALGQSQTVTRRISQVMRTAEEEAAAPFKGDYTGQPASPGGTDGSSEPGVIESGASANGRPWTLKDTALLFGKTLLWSYRDRSALASIIAARGQWGKMVRFAQDADGMWRAFGSRAAKEALGLPGHMTRFGAPAIERSIRSHSFFEMIKTAARSDGPWSTRAAQLLDDIKGIGGIKTPPLWSANGFLKNVKGPAIISTLITTGLNVYEFGFGANKDKGLLSREFLTSTGADVTAGLGIVGVSTAIGTMIPIPGVGTAAGFVVGLGLQYAYDRWGKDTWRGVVDSAAQRVGSGLDAAWNTARPLAERIERAASDAWEHVGQAGKDIGRSVVETFNSFTASPARLVSPLAWAFGD